MLDVFIIEKIKEEERKKREIDRPYLEITDWDIIPPDEFGEEKERKKKKEEEDGIIIIE